MEHPEREACEPHNTRLESTRSCRICLCPHLGRGWAGGSLEPLPLILPCSPERDRGTHTGRGGRDILPGSLGGIFTYTGGLGSQRLPNYLSPSLSQDKLEAPEWPEKYQHPTPLLMPYIYVVAGMEGHVSAPLRMSTIGSGIWELGPQGWGGLGGAAAQVEEVCHPGAGAGFGSLKPHCT